MKIQKTHFILYVANQENSTAFYSQLLGMKPSLNVPGMTEFELSANTILGLMPESGIEKIVSPPLPKPSAGNGIPRCELYFYTEQIDELYMHAITLGAQSISIPQARNWGDYAAYIADVDGHIIALAKKLTDN